MKKKKLESKRIFIKPHKQRNKSEKQFKIQREKKKKIRTN